MNNTNNMSWRKIIMIEYDVNTHSCEYSLGLSININPLYLYLWVLATHDQFSVDHQNTVMVTFEYSSTKKGFYVLGVLLELSIFICEVVCDCNGY